MENKNQSDNNNKAEKKNGKGRKKNKGKGQKNDKQNSQQQESDNNLVGAQNSGEEQQQKTDTNLSEEQKTDTNLSPEHKNKVKQDQEKKPDPLPDQEQKPEASLAQEQKPEANLAQEPKTDEKQDHEKKPDLIPNQEKQPEAIVDQVEESKQQPQQAQTEPRQQPQPEQQEKHTEESKDDHPKGNENKPQEPDDHLKEKETQPQEPEKIPDNSVEIIDKEVKSKLEEQVIENPPKKSSHVEEEVKQAQQSAKKSKLEAEPEVLPGTEQSQLEASINKSQDKAQPEDQKQQEEPKAASNDDAHERILHSVADQKKNPVEPAQTEPKKSADESVEKQGKQQQEKSELPQENQNADNQFDIEKELSKYSTENNSGFQDIMFQSQYEMALEYKSQADLVAQQKDYSQAQFLYEQAYDLINPEQIQCHSPDVKSKQQALFSELLEILGDIMLKLQNAEKIMKYGSKLLKIDPQNLQAIYRQGIAHKLKNDYTESMRYLRKALDLAKAQSKSTQFISDEIKAVEQLQSDKELKRQQQLEKEQQRQNQLQKERNQRQTQQQKAAADMNQPKTFPAQEPNLQQRNGHDRQMNARPEQAPPQKDAQVLYRPKNPKNNEKVPTDLLHRQLQNIEKIRQMGLNLASKHKNICQPTLSVLAGCCLSFFLKRKPISKSFQTVVPFGAALGVSIYKYMKTQNSYHKILYTALSSLLLVGLVKFK